MRLLLLLQRIHYALINGEGRWIAWIMYAQALPSYGIPSYRQLRFNTRRVKPEIIDEADYNHPSDGTEPVSVLVHLVKYDITRWLGKPTTLYATYTYIRVTFGNYRPHFERSRGFVDPNAARADFLKLSRTPKPVTDEALAAVVEEA